MMGVRCCLWKLDIFTRERCKYIEEFMAAAGEYSDKVMHDFPREGLDWAGGWEEL